DIFPLVTDRLAIPDNLHDISTAAEIVDEYAMVDRLISSTGCQLIAETIYRHGPTGWQLYNRQTSADAIYFDVHSKDADARSS
ncbi:hypothetical protein ACCS64_39115, partial [Rhizobium ruizarguesonis]